MRAFGHEAVHRVVLAPGSDERAPGGAITVELCGQWDHEGECRWPHHTAVERDGDTLVVRTAFDAPAGDAAGVRSRIERALSAGRLDGPDRTSRWRLVTS